MEIDLIAFLTLWLKTSKAESKRLIKHGAVWLYTTQTIGDIRHYRIDNGDILRVGRKYIKLVWK